MKKLIFLIHRDRRKEFCCNQGPENPKGFSLVEVLVGVALVSVAMMGLAQLLVLSISNNTRSAQISRAIFLARQQVEEMRLLKSDELQPLVGTLLDEQLDLDLDGIYDFRRITRIQMSGVYYEVKVWVFGPLQLSASRDDLISDPLGNNVRTQITTLISRGS